MQAVRLSLALRLGAVRGDTAPSCRKLCAEPRALHKSITSVRGWGAGCSVHEAADPSCLQWLGKERYRETPIRKLILAIHFSFRGENPLPSVSLWPHRFSAGPVGCGSEP